MDVDLPAGSLCVFDPIVATSVIDRPNGPRDSHAASMSSHEVVDFSSDDGFGTSTRAKEERWLGTGLMDRVWLLLAGLLSMVDTRREMAVVMKARPLPPLLRLQSMFDFIM